MAARCARLTSREIDAAATSLFLPVMLMVTFVYLFGGAISTGTRYITYVVPGVLLLCAGVGSATTAVTVCRDMTGGIIDRFRSMDVGSLPVLSGHVAASVARNAASTVLVFAVALGIGFRPHAGPAAWAAASGCCALRAGDLLARRRLRAAGLLARGGQRFMFAPMIVTYASSAFVPVRTMPSWLHGFAGHQPATPVIETLRGLLLGTHVGSAPWTALIWCGGLLAVAAAVSGVLFPPPHRLRRASQAGLRGGRQVLPDRLGQRVTGRQEPLTVGQGVLEHGDRVGEATNRVVGGREVGPRGQRVRVIRAHDPLVVLERLLVQRDGQRDPASRVVRGREVPARGQRLGMVGAVQPLEAGQAGSYSGRACLSLRAVW